MQTPAFARSSRAVRRGTGLLLAVLLLAALLIALLPPLPLAAQTDPPLNIKPEFVTLELPVQEYDGVSDDLLTAGMGSEGLANPTGAVAAPFADPDNPTAAELRRRAIHTNYRAIVDTTPGGGYGELFGPTVGVSGDGKIAGKEYLAYADDGSGNVNVTMMVQIPASFDPQNPCIITGPSSGSRGVYGAIGSSGEWGLKKGCAVAYTDKGSGMGVHDLDRDLVNLIDGQIESAALAGDRSHFTAPGVTLDFLRDNPDRLAFKHAHSQQNPEADWGSYVLQSLEYAFYVLNLPENYGQESNGGVTQTITPDNTIVIASSVSNGGGASLRAAEQDTKGLIDGIAVSEPNISPMVDANIVISEGERSWRYPNVGRALLDYYSLLNVFQPCANLDPEIKNDAPFNITDPVFNAFFVSEELGQNRCAALKAAGLLEANTVDAQAAEAQQIINNYGILTEQNIIQPAHHSFVIIESIAMLYANAYGRFSVADNLCGYSYSAGVTGTGAAPTELDLQRLKRIFATGNGIPPTEGVTIFNNNAQGGPAENRGSTSMLGTRDQNLAGALCLRRLATGVDEQGRPLTGAELERHQRVMAGIAGVRGSGDLQGKPTIIVHGRSDAILPPNHTSRAYYALNQYVEGGQSQLRYYEVTNAQHLDAFNGFPGFSNRYVPLHYYFNDALDRIYDHLVNGSELPPSQVIETTPRGVAGGPAQIVPPLTSTNVPLPAEEPAAEDQITFNAESPGAVDMQRPFLTYLPAVARPDDVVPTEE